MSAYQVPEWGHKMEKTGMETKIYRITDVEKDRDKILEAAEVLKNGGLVAFPTDTVYAVGACISAGVFGSHICFYSDATVLTSAACGCDNFRHAFTQMPYGIIAAICSFIMYAIFGFVMA